MNTIRKTNQQIAKQEVTASLAAVHVGSRTELDPKEIILITAEVNYSYIHLRNGRKLLVSTNIQKLQERLLGIPEMVRVHRSYIINTSYLKSYSAAQVKLKNNLSCPISRRKREFLLTSLTN